MGMMKKILYMLENDFGEDKIAWYIFLNGNAGGWHSCKEVAREMRDDYENTRKKDTDNGNDSETEKRSDDSE